MALPCSRSEVSLRNSEVDFQYIRIVLFGSGGGVRVQQQLFMPRAHRGAVCYVTMWCDGRISVLMYMSTE